MLGGFRSPGTQRRREGGIDDSRGTMWSERREGCKKKSQRNKLKENKERNKSREGCSIRVSDGESVK